MVVPKKNKEVTSGYDEKANPDLQVVDQEDHEPNQRSPVVRKMHHLHPIGVEDWCLDNMGGCLALGAKQSMVELGSKQHQQQLPIYQSFPHQESNASKNSDFSSQSPVLFADIFP
ncbi:hypothetical protein SAY86_027179 [Trapa natans]|uniref:Uncharacterized protein n=1 Tax=Trapa natans TaxID=22666 RepID=A0AAN7KKB1_TRANT|nr:hypothetical protein SAY86_027179 [Trapa natans]